MTIRELLRGEISKRHAREIGKMTLENPLIFEELWTIAVSDELPINWRAAWVIKGIWETNPNIVTPHIGQMRLALANINQHGVKREFLKMISENPLPDDENELGILLKCCFDWLADPLVPIVVKIHSMDILFKISKRIPEIIPELKTTIEVAMQEGSAGTVNKGGKMLKALHKIKGK